MIPDSQRCESSQPVHGWADRELVMFTALLAVALIFAAQEWFCLHLRREPLVCGALRASWLRTIRSFYLRHRRYKAFYGAHSTPFKSLKKE